MAGPEDALALRDGIFALRTRRLGSGAELMVKRLIKATRALNQYHDLFLEADKHRIEVKFSTVLKKEVESITERNVINAILAASTSNRAVPSSEWRKHQFDCNIQQVKCIEFDVLYYGLFFSDKIALFSMTAAQVPGCRGYSDKQHKGNIGEGQCHVTRDTFDYHLTSFLRRWLTYEELYDLLCT